MGPANVVAFNDMLREYAIHTDISLCLCHCLCVCVLPTVVSVRFSCGQGNHFMMCSFISLAAT